MPAPSLKPKATPETASAAPVVASPSAPAKPVAATPKLLSGPAALKPGAKAARVPKTFSIAEWGSDNEGEKVVLYGKSGTGKTTLASLIEGAVFIGLDDGGRKIVNPKTGKRLIAIPNITSFDDVRDALNQKSLWPDGCTIVIDTMTKLEEMSEDWIMENYRTKAGRAQSMRAFGWDASSHYLDATRLILGDLEPHVRLGRNVVLLCQLGQIRVSNAEGLDYLEDGPRMSHNNQHSARQVMCEWADHVFRLGYNGMSVKAAEGAKTGKLELADDAQRVVYTGGAPHFIAKTRPTKFGTTLPPLIDFSTKETDDLWQYLLNGANAA